MIGDLQRTLGERLRAYRLERAISQEELAESLDMHRTYVGSVERGERNLSLQALERLAESLDVEPLDLLR